MLRRQNDASVKLTYTQPEFNPEVYQSQISRGSHNETAVLFGPRLPTHLLQRGSHPLPCTLGQTTLFAVVAAQASGLAVLLFLECSESK